LQNEIITMTRRYNLSHSAGQPMPEDWIHLPDSVVAATDYDALAQLVCDLWHSSAAAHIPPGLQKRVRDAAYAQSVEAQRFLHGAAAVTGLTQQDYDALVRDSMLWRTRSPTGAGGNVKAFVCCEGVGQHAPGCIAQEAAP
jgi:hypothetical protein